MLLRAALVHDLDEVPFGDSPGPAKRLTGDKQRSLEAGWAYICNRFDVDTQEAYEASRNNRDIMTILKVADRIDEVFWCHTETSLGNTYMCMGHQHPRRVDILDKLLADLKRDWALLPFGNVPEVIKVNGWFEVYDKACNGPRYLKEGEF